MKTAEIRPIRQRCGRQVIDADGEVPWRITAKGIAVGDGEADWPEDSRYGLDS